jgi:hypothetical protein
VLVQLAARARTVAPVATVHLAVLIVAAAFRVVYVFDRAHVRGTRIYVSVCVCEEGKEEDEQRPRGIIRAAFTHTPLDTSCRP